MTKEKLLKEWGAEDIDLINDTYHFVYDGYSYSTSDIYKTEKETIDNATLYSCCGDEVDKDWMMCPTCKEHI